MKKYLYYSIQFVIPSVCLLIFFVFIFLSLRSGSIQEEGRIWKGYYTLLIESGQKEKGLEDAVSVLASKAGFSNVLSKETSYISFYDYEDKAAIPVSELENRFDSLDPRYDPFMKHVPRYFKTGYQGKDWDIVYLKSEGSPLSAYMSVRETFKGRNLDWVLLDVSLFKWIFSQIFFILFAVFMVYISKGFRLLASLSALPWYIAVISGSIIQLISVSALYFAWLFFLEEAIPFYRYILNYRKYPPERLSLIARAVFLLSTFLLIIIIHLGEGETNVLPIITAFLSLIFLAVATAFYFLLKRKSQIHRIFMPIQILRENIWGIWRGRFSAYIVWLLMILLLPLLSLMIFNNNDSYRVPSPESYAGIDSFSYDSLHHLWFFTKEQELPNLANYLAHRAYQEGFAYGRDYGFPSRDEKLEISHYTKEGGKIIHGKKLLIEFSDQWLIQNLREGGRGIEIMLRDQGIPTAVVLKEAPAFSLSPSVVIKYAVLVFLLFSPFLISGIRYTLTVIDGLGDITKRRKRIEI